MRTALALAALAAVAATTSVEAQSTCTNASLAFITETTGPFAQVCAASVTQAALAPFSSTVSLTTLLDPTSSVVSFLVSDPVTSAVNTALALVIGGIAQQSGVPGLNLTTVIAASQGSFSRFPASVQNPYGYNFTRMKEALSAGPFSALASTLVDKINGTMLGASNYVLCPALKNITQSLIGCVPSSCNTLALNLCLNPTQANAVQLMGSFADKPFTVGTLTILANIGASCAGGLQFQQNSQLATVRAALGYSYTDSTFDASCAVLANSALAGTFQYPVTKSPTTKSAGAALGAGVLAAAAAVAAVVAF